MKIFYTLLTALLIKCTIQAQVIPLKPGSSHFTPHVQTTLDPETQVEIEKTEKELTKAKRDYKLARTQYQKSLENQKNIIPLQCNADYTTYLTAKSYYETSLGSQWRKNTGQEIALANAARKALDAYNKCQISLKEAQIKSQDLYKVQQQALHTLDALKAKLNKLQHTSVPVSKPAPPIIDTPLPVEPIIQPAQDPTEADPYLRKNHTGGTFTLN